MKNFNREAIQRMFDGRKGGGGGGTNNADLAGYATQMWVNQNYVSIEFFNRLFSIHGHDPEDESTPPTDISVLPNDMDSIIDSIESMVGFWTEEYLTSLGLNSGSGGSTSLADLLDVSISSPQNGQVLTYNSSTGKWENADPSSPGGSGTVTSVGVSVPLGFAVNNTPVTTSGTIAITFATGYALPTTAKQTAWDTAASGVTTLQGYFDANGVANQAASLSATNKTLWGNTYWTSDGVPTSIGYDSSHTASLSNVANINMSGSVNFKIGEDYTSGLGVWNSSSLQILYLGYYTTTEKSYTTNIYGSSIGFFYGTSRGMTLDSSGSVGIGTYSPYTKLHVNGGVKAARFYLYKPNSADDTGAVYLEYDNTNNRNGVHLVGAGFYSDSYVSAMGANSQSGGSTTSLAGLTDTNITSPQNGQALIYNSTQGKWINGSIASGTVTAVSVNGTQYNPQSGIVTLPAYPSKTSWNYDDRYLPLTGGTLASTSSNTPLTLKSNAAASWLAFKDSSDTFLGSFGVDENKDAKFYNGSTYKILHSGNLVGGTNISVSLNSTTGNYEISNSYSYTLPPATDSVLGGVKIGSTMAISSGVINQKSGIVTAGTYRSVTVDTYGRVTAGTNPTTLAGYGITDAVKNDTTWWGQAISNGAVTGSLSNVYNITMSGQILMGEWYIRVSQDTREVADPYAGGRKVLDAYSWDSNAESYRDILIGTYIDAFQYGGLYFRGERWCWGIGTDSPNTKLDVNGGVKASKFYLVKPNAGNDTGAVYFVYDSTNSGVRLVGAGFYSDSYVSAMGVNSSGGSGGGGSLYLLTDVKPNSDSTPTAVYGLNGTTADNGKVLMYDRSLTKWVAGTIEATDTKNTAGVNRSNNTKLYLVGSKTSKTNSAADYDTTFTSDKCYIGTDNCLYSNGSKVLTSVTGYLPLTGGTLTDASHQVLGIRTTTTDNDSWAGYSFGKDIDGTITRYGGVAMRTGVDGLQRYDVNYQFYKVWDDGNDGSGSGLDADLLDGYHANNIYNAITTNFSQGNSANTWVRYATITFPSTGLSAAGFTAVFTNYEMPEQNSFIVYLLIRRNADFSTISSDFFYTPLGSAKPRDMYVRSDDGITFYVYIRRDASTYNTFYRITRLQTNGTVAFENVDLGSPISGSVVNKQAVISGAYTLDNIPDGTTRKLANYLPLTGGTLTGASNTPLTLKSNTTSTWLSFVNSEGSHLGSIGVDSDHKPVFYYSATKTIAFTDSDITGNAATATKLAASVSLWGQSFNGIADVAGDITVGNGSIYLNNNKYIYWKDSYEEIRAAIFLSDSNNFRLGYGTASAGYDTIISGNNIKMTYGTSRTDGIILNNSGNVGIGVAIPSYKLSVDGDVSATNFRGDLIGNADTATTATKLSTVSQTLWGNLYWTANGQPASFGYDASHTASLSYVSDINMGGYIYEKIGNDYTGVLGTWSQYSLLWLGYYSATGKSYSTGIYGNNVSLYYGTSATRGLFLNSSGNIGIGTDSPSTKLHVVGASGTDAVKIVSASNADPLTLNTTRSYNVTKYYLSDTFKWSVGCDADKFYWYSSATVFSILNGGNVSIGSTSSTFITEKLNVNGNIRTSASNGAYIQIGDIRIVYDNDATNGNNALKVVKSDGTAANFYATGAVSALGANTSSGTVTFGFSLSGTTLSVGSNQSVNLASSFVSLSGAQVVTGRKTFNGGIDVGADMSTAGSITPFATGQYSIGTASRHFSNAFFDAVNIYGDATITGAVSMCSGKISFSYATGSGVSERTELNTNGKTFYLNTGTATPYYSTQWQSSSDMRKKNIVHNVGMSIDQIAGSPIFAFKWRGQKDNSVSIGTSAQYWQGVLPEVVSTAPDGFLAMDYTATAIAATIITARKVLNHEDRIRELEERLSLSEAENKALRKEIELLKAA